MFVLVIPGRAQESKPSIRVEAGKGVLFQSADSTFTLAIGGRIQSLFEYKYDITNETRSADFLLRRCRLNIQGNAFNPRFSYRIQLGFAHGDITSANSAVQNNLVLRDAMLFYKPAKWLRIGFGQTKLPGNRQRQVSSSSLQLVERSIANNNFTLDRDKGVWIYSHFNMDKAILNATLSVSSGEGRIVSDKNGKLCYSARVEFLPFGDFSNRGDFVEADLEREAKPKLSLASVYSFNHASTRVMGQLGDYLYNSETSNTQYYGVDIMYKHRGFSLESEFYNRHSNKAIITNDNDTTQHNYVVSGSAFMIQSGMMISKTNEVSARYAQIWPHKSVTSVMNGQKEYVIGFSHYFNKHSLKIQSDLTYLENGDHKNMIYRCSGVVTF